MLPSSRAGPKSQRLGCTVIMTPRQTVGKRFVALNACPINDAACAGHGQALLATGQASNSPIVSLAILLANAGQADSDPGRSPAGQSPLRAITIRQRSRSAGLHDHVQGETALARPGQSALARRPSRLAQHTSRVADPSNPHADRANCHRRRIRAAGPGRSANTALRQASCGCRTGRAGSDHRSPTGLALSAQGCVRDRPSLRHVSGGQASDRIDHLPRDALLGVVSADQRRLFPR
jgi:hypothetical protein